LEVGRLEGGKVGRWEGWKVGRLEGGKVGRWEGWKVGRLEGGKVWRFEPAWLLSYAGSRGLEFWRFESDIV